MKSRTSYFNATIFKKNLTRFAPAWGLYTIFLLLCQVSMIDGGSRWYAANLADVIQIMSIFTPCYALVCAQLLFGDLYNPRMCNALHALPMRRETWFVTHILSGFVFHLIPSLVFALLGILFTLLACFPGDWFACLVWLLGVNLQFTCFFGIAVLSAFCVGSRFAQALVYGIVNFGSLILGWLVDTLFVPMYYGIQIRIEPFFWFSPMGRMLQEPFVTHSRSYQYDSEQLQLGNILPGENFLYYFLVAAVGLGLILLALQLYRRRKLEFAGDFIAIPGLAPVFLVVYTLIMGTVFHFIADDMFGLDTLTFLFLGLPVGWFTGRMFLERTPKVFQLPNILRCGALMAICGLTLAIAAFDPFGIESWLPEPEDVESVTISDGHYSYHRSELVLDEQAEIRNTIAIHSEVISEHQNGIQHQTTFTDAYQELILEKSPPPMDFSMSITFTYQLKNGTIRSRYYNVWMGGESGLYLKALFNTPEAVFGSGITEDKFLQDNSLLILRSAWDGEEIYIYQSEEIRSLYRAILADCQDGTMAQQWDFHHQPQEVFWINRSGGEALTIFSDAENTLNWLRNYGVDVDAQLELFRK